MDLPDGDLLRLARSSNDRIEELLKANNALLQRARKAETDLAEKSAILGAVGLRLENLLKFVGEGVSARPAPDPTATREYGEDDKEEGLLQAEDAIMTMMREQNCTFPEAVKHLAAKQHFANPNSWRPPSEAVYLAEIDRLQAALAEMRRGKPEPPPMTAQKRWGA